MAKPTRAASRTRLYGEKYTRHMQGRDWHRERLATGYVDDGVWVTFDAAGDELARLVHVAFGWMLNMYSLPGSWQVTTHGPFPTSDEAAYHAAAILGDMGPVAA